MRKQKFRARLTRCVPKEASWDCAGTASVLTNAYVSESQLVARAIPKNGRFKVQVFITALETYKGFAYTLIVAKGEIIEREMH